MTVYLTLFRIAVAKLTDVMQHERVHISLTQFICELSAITDTIEVSATVLPTYFIPDRVFRGQRRAALICDMRSFS